jgi:hypothetical protein
MKWLKAQERIASQCQRSKDGCLLWTRSKVTRGYGQCWFEGKMHAAHRLALEAKLGRRLEPGEQACHTCDTPSCCEPSHLFAGTHADNMADAKAKGRGVKFQKAEIRRLIDSGVSKASIARALGCTVRTVFRAAGGPSPRGKSRPKLEGQSRRASPIRRRFGEAYCEQDSQSATTNDYCYLRDRDFNVMIDALRAWRGCHA